jgi:hypothetical protein
MIDGTNENQEILAYPMLYTFQSFCGYAFQNEMTLNVSSLATEDDCQAACAQANTNFGGPLCKGLMWNGTCTLYTDALASDLIASPGSDAAILVGAYPVQSPNNFTATTGSPEQTSDALAFITGGNFTYQTPPAVLVLPGNMSTVTFSSCSGSTSTTGNVIRWTSSCSENVSWYQDIVASTTAVYTSTVSGQSGLAWSGGGEQSLTVPISPMQTGITGSEWQSEWATGGEMTITTVISNSTVVYVTIPTPSAFVISGEDRSDILQSDSTTETTITTTISSSTVVYVSTIVEGSAWSSKWNDGGKLTIVPTVPSVTGSPSGPSWSIPTNGYNSSEQDISDRFPLATELASLSSAAAASNAGLWSYSTAFSIGGDDRDSFESVGVVTVVVDTVSYPPTNQSMTASSMPANTSAIEIVTISMPDLVPSATTNHSRGETFTPGTYWNGTLTIQPDNTTSQSNDTEASSTVSYFSPSPVETPSNTSISAIYWNTTSSMPSTDNSTSQTPTNDTVAPSTTSEMPSGIYSALTNWNQSSTLPTYNSSSELPLNLTGSPAPTGHKPNAFIIPFENRPGADPSLPVPTMTAPYQNVSQSVVTVTVTESCPICSTTTPFPLESLFSPSFTLDEPTSSPSSVPTSAPFSNTTTLSNTTISSLARPRSPNTSATDDEIAAACAYNGNNIYNGGFEQTFLANSIPVPQNFGWATNDAKSVQFLSSTEPDQITPNGSWVVQFASSRASAVGTLWQPLTLCPGGEYVVGGYARQNDTSDGCEGRFGISGVPAGMLVPGVDWTSGFVNGTVYSVGGDRGNANVNLEITIQCGRIPDGGIGVMELDEISLTRVA